MPRFNHTAIKNLPRRYRTQLINSLSGFKSVNLVGTVNRSGQENLSIVSSVVHLGANPALMGFIMRPVTVRRDTYQNIQELGYFTFNHILADFYEAAHQTSAKYDAEVSEFAAVGLHPLYKDDFPAPYVKESPIQIGLKYTESLNIESNGTILVVGEVQELYYPAACLMEDGYLDIEAAGTITCSGLDTYHTTQRLSSLAYAQPGELPKEKVTLHDNKPKA